MPVLPLGPAQVTSNSCGWEHQVVAVAVDAMPRPATAGAKVLRPLPLPGPAPHLSGQFRLHTVRAHTHDRATASRFRAEVETDLRSLHLESAGRAISSP